MCDRNIGNAKKRRTVALIAMLFLLKLKVVLAQQQAFNYTQYMDNLTPFNPAYSLLDKAGSINTMARKQWVGIDGAPASYLVNGNLPIESISAAAGLIVLTDQIAIEHETEVNAYFAKSIKVGESSYLAVSLNAGLRNYTANYSTLDDTDPTFRTDIRETKPNVGFGIMYFTNWYYVGVSAPEITLTSLGTASEQNTVNFLKHYYLAGALITNLNEDIKFKPATLITYVKGQPLVADISGTIYMKDVLGLGLNYRTSHATAAILTLNINSFHIGYSYQFGTSSTNLGGYNAATHEITLGYRFGKGAGNVKLL